MKKAVFIGRFQPYHKGHEWLVDNKLKKGVPVLIMVRDIPPDNKNPFTTEQTVEIITERYCDEDVQVMIIPDIESVNWGRGVGYEVNEFIPPEDIKRISATQIRAQIKEKNDSWKDFVDEKIQHLVEKYLTE